MISEAVAPLRHWMIEDMTVRQFGEHTHVTTSGRSDVVIPRSGCAVSVDVRSLEGFDT